MNNFRSWVEDTRAGNHIIRYSDGTKLPSGKLKKFPYMHVDKTQTAVIDGEKKTGKFLANALARQLVADHILGKLKVVNTSLSLEDVIEKFMSDAQKRKTAKEIAWTTVHNYQMICDRIVRYFKSLQDMANIDRIREWKIHLEAHPYAPTTVFTCLNTLAILCNWLIENKYLDESPFKNGQIMKYPKPKPRFWTIPEFEAVERSAAELDRDFQIGLHLAHSVGLRLVEMVGDGEERLAGVLWEDLIWHEDGTVDLLIRREITKGQEDERLLRLPPELIDLLGSRKTGPIVPLTRDQFYHLMNKAKANAGITQKRTPHGLRHSLGKNFIQAGGDLKALQKTLGHKSIKTTDEVYSHTEQAYQTTQMEKAHAYVRQQIAIAKTMQGKKTSFLPNLAEVDRLQQSVTERKAGSNKA